MKQYQSVISLPKEDVRELLETMADFEKSQEKIEDYLMLNNLTLHKKILQARREHLAGRIKKFKI